MEYLSIIKDSDIFENPKMEPNEYISRPTSRVIILDIDENICVYSINGHTFFPGGGIEKDETPEQASIRECKEEVGCNIEIISKLGEAIQLRAEQVKKYEIYFFVARNIGEKGVPTTTQENELNIIVDWLPKEKINLIFENQISSIPKDDYPAQFNCRTHLEVFKKYLESQTGI